MDSKVNKEEMEKRKNKDQIAHDKMISEGGSVYDTYNKKDTDKGDKDDKAE